MKWMGSGKKSDEEDEEDRNVVICAMIVHHRACKLCVVVGQVRVPTNGSCRPETRGDIEAECRHVKCRVARMRHETFHMSARGPMCPE